MNTLLLDYVRSFAETFSVTDTGEIKIYPLPIAELVSNETGGEFNLMDVLKCICDNAEQVDFPSSHSDAMKEFSEGGCMSGELLLTYLDIINFDSINHETFAHIHIRKVLIQEYVKLNTIISTNQVH